MVSRVRAMRDKRRAAALRLIEGDSVLNIMCGKLIRPRDDSSGSGCRLGVSGLKMAEDALFNLEAALCAREIAYVHRVAYRYRIHSQSATGSRTGRRMGGASGLGWSPCGICSCGAASWKPYYAPLLEQLRPSAV